MKKLLLFVVVAALIAGCASCRWCKSNCKKTEYIDKAVNIYVYPALLKEPMPEPEFAELSPDLDLKLRTLIDLLQAIEDDRGKCVDASATACDRTSVSDDLMAQMATTLASVNELYFKEQVVQVSNLSEAIAYYKHLEWQVKNYEEQILDIIARESKDPAAVKNQ